MTMMMMSSGLNNVSIHDSENVPKFQKHFMPYFYGLNFAFYAVVYLNT